MDAIRQAATGISVAAVILGAAYMLCPDGVMNKKMKYIIGLVMLLCTITPFINASVNLNPTPSASLQLNADEMLISQTEYIISSTLESEGAVFEKIEISADILEGGNISISSVYIYGARDKEKIKSLIESTFRVQEVVFIDGR